jgi:rRNA-processing protein FCF1
MVSVLVDACGWVSLIDAGLNLDISLNEVVGKADLKITPGVRDELDSLAKSRSGLLLDLLYSRAEVIDSEEGHTDDGLLALASRNRWPVLTVDRILKKRLVEGGCSYIEVTSGPSLRPILTAASSQAWA